MGEDNLRFGRVLLAAVLLAGSLSACSLLTPDPPPPEIRWRSLARGMPEAAASHRPALVDYYYGRGCHRCERFLEDIYVDPEIVERINSRFVPIRISLQGQLSPLEKALSDKMANNGECLLMFMDDQGRVIRRAGGGSAICSMAPMKAKEFIGMLDEVEGVLGKKDHITHK